MITSKLAHSESVTALMPNCYQLSLEVEEFMQIWDDEKVDLIFTDPPYPMGMAKKAYFKSANYNQGDELNFYDTMTNEKLEQFIQECYRVLKNNSHFFIMTNEANLQKVIDYSTNSGFELKQKVIWIKRKDWSDGAAMGRYFLNAYEYVLLFSKGKIEPINTKMNVFVKKPQTRGMNSKPEELVAHCIDTVMTDTKVAIDPFAGSDPLARSKLRGLIKGITYSNVYGTTEGNDPAKWGNLLKNTLRGWGA